jgi:bifunctional non-homologous end joining protein LigD
VTWEEVENALKKKDAGLLVFESHQTLKRIEKLGDLFAPLLSLKQKLPKLAGLGAAETAAAPEGLEMAAQARGGSRTPSGKSAAPAAGKRKPARPSSARKPGRKL